MVRIALCLICVAFAPLCNSVIAAPIHDAVLANKLDDVKKWVEAHEKGLDSSAPAEVQKTVINSGSSVGRNDPCPCGSGKKFKKCCE